MHCIHGRVLLWKPRARWRGFHSYSECFIIVPGAFSSVCLGVATNNVAELAALQFLCEHLFELLSRISPSSRPPVFVFIDNRYAIESANSDKKCKANRRQVGLTRRAVSALRTLTDVSLRWVPAHAEVDGNEDADTLAKRGAKGTTSSDPPSPPSPPALAPAQLSPHLVLDPDLELADDLDDSDHAPAPAPSPVLPPAPSPVVTARRSSRIQAQVHSVPAARYCGGKVDFSSAWSKRKKHHRGSPAREAALPMPSLSVAVPNAPPPAPAPRKRKSPPPRFPAQGLGRFGWKRPRISSSSSSTSRKRPPPAPLNQPHPKRRIPH